MCVEQWKQDISRYKCFFENAKRFVGERKDTIEFHSQDNSRIEFEAFEELIPILGTTNLVALSNTARWA